MSKELLEALADLRNDPMVRSAIDSGRKQNDSANDPNRITPQKKYFEDRESAREGVGTRNWLQTHREELSASEKKRLDTRLRAENMFAVAQMEYEQLVNDLRGNGKAQDDVGHREYDDPRPQSTQSTPAADRYRSSPAPQQPSGPVASVHTPSPTEHRRGYVLDHGRSSSLPAAAAASLHRVEVEDAAPMEDEETIYRRKLRELHGDEPSQPRGRSPPPETASGAHQSPANMHSSKAASLPYRQNEAQRRFDQDYAALMEAVQQRDRTIERLERLQREDRDYYEGQLLQKKAELENVRSACEARISAMKSEMTHLLDRTQHASQASNHDVKAQLASIEASYERGLGELRTEFNSLLTNYQAECERRMREITEAAEKAVRVARDSYNIDHSKALDEERQALVSRLQKEQDLMLRDAELKLRTELEKVLFNRVKASLEGAVRAQLRQELLPVVQRELTAQLKAQLTSTMLHELREAFIKRAEDWQKQQQELLRQQRELQDHANTARQKGDEEAMKKGEEIAQILSQFASLQHVAEEKLKAQQEAQVEHQRRIREGTERIKALEASLAEAEEKRLQHQVAEQQAKDSQRTPPAMRRPHH